MCIDWIIVKVIQPIFKPIKYLGKKSQSVGGTPQLHLYRHRMASFDENFIGKCHLPYERWLDYNRNEYKIIKVEQSWSHRHTVFFIQTVKKTRQMCSVTWNIRFVYNISINILFITIENRWHIDIWLINPLLLQFYRFGCKVSRCIYDFNLSYL